MREMVRARLVGRAQLSDEICTFTLEAVDGRFLGCAAGAHVDVQLADALVRSYSLVDWGEAGEWVRIAVKRETEGRGGSLAMHALEVGRELLVGAPRNNFPLVSGDGPVVLFGGGVGITPIYAMARALRAAGRPFDLHYLVRTRGLAAFHPAILDLDLGATYRLHCDEEDGLPDFEAILRNHRPATQLYVCGPEPMLNAVQKASDELEIGTVFLERFSAPPPEPTGDERSFQVVLDSTGEEHHVPPDRSILQVLRDAGHDVDYACAEGTCGTCITDVLEGEIDHRDVVLTDEERAAGDCMCLCVSRARCDRLVLDL